MKIRIQELDKPNKNGRIYTTESVKAAIEKHQGDPVLGTLGVPETEKIDITKVSHVVTNLAIEDGYLVGELTILKTPSGDKLSSILEDGIAFRPNGIGMVSNNGTIDEYTLTSISAIDKEKAA